MSDMIVLGESIEIASPDDGQRAGIEIRSEKISFDFDVAARFGAVAAAAAQVIRERIAAISEAASANTIRARKTAARAYARGKAWAIARYGDRAPDATDRLFNDSGRLATSVEAAQNDDTWEVSVDSSRLTASTLDGRRDGGGAALRTILDRLVSLIAELGDVTALLESPAVAAAFEEAVNATITKNG